MIHTYPYTREKLIFSELKMFLKDAFFLTKGYSFITTAK